MLTRLYTNLSYGMRSYYVIIIIITIIIIYKLKNIKYTAWKCLDNIFCVHE